jgi:hypothetical protein
MALTLEKNGEKPKTTTFEEILNVFQNTRNMLFFITGNVRKKWKMPTKYRSTKKF